LPCVKALLDNGADPTITNHAGHDAVYEAELNEKTEVVDWVLKEGGEGLEEGIGREGVGGGEEESGEDVEAGVEVQREEGGVVGGEEGIREGMGSLGVKDGTEDL
jgi:uncharacterized protein